MSKIDVRAIFRDHFKTLVNANTAKAELSDWLLFLFIPIGIASLIIFSFSTVDKDVANIVITILSIFVGLLINVIVLLFDIVRKDEKETTVKNDVLRETLSNISYTILVSIIGVVVTLGTFFRQLHLQLILSFLSYFLLAHIIITVMMIIKRMYALFTNEMKN